MKNFTKQFTNKTLFKPTRWILLALMLLLGTSSAWADHIQSTGSMCLKYWPGSGSDIWTSAIDLGKTLNLGDISGTPYIKAAWVKTQGGTSINYLKIVIYIDGVYKGDYGVNYNGNSSYWDRTFEGSFNIAFNTTPGEHTIEIKAEPNNAEHGSTYVKYNVPGAVDPCATKYYLAGTFPGLSWTPGESGGQEMECKDGVHTKTYKNVKLEAKKYEYKVTGKNGWGDKEYPGDGNSEYTVKSAGNYNVTFTYVPNSSLTVSLESACSAPSGVSIIGAPTTKPCPGDQVTLKASIGAGDVDSYKWSVSGDGWSINSGETANSCTFTVGTATGKISLKVNGCNTDVDASINIDVKSKPTKSDYTLQSSVEYGNGAPSITPKQGIPVPTTIKYGTTLANATTTAPTAVGTYNVYITTDATTDYCAATDLYIGEFTITCPTLTAPTLSVEQHIVKCGTDVTQKGKITISGLVTGNTYTYKVGDNGTAQSLTFTGTSATLSNLETGGKYIVTASNGCDTESADATVNVTTNTKATLSWNEIPNGFLVADETIEATFSPEGAGSVTYTSDNETVIAPNNGKLTAQPNKNGTANITATLSLNDGYCGATAITKNSVPVKFFNVAGTANLCGGAWNTTANPMTYNNGVWSKTFEAKPADVYEFQISREEWDGNWEDRKKIYNGMGNITCKEIHRTDGGDWYNIEFTTPTKGDVTIKFTEGKGSYVEFEPICITEDDVTAGAISVGQISADKDQYNYNETAKLSIADATIDAAYGSVYSISYQWQKKNGESYENIQGATDQTYNATNLEVGTHKYRVAVTFSYNEIKNCTLTKYSEEKTINVICPAPTTPLEISSTNVVRCGGSTKTHGTITINNYSVYGENTYFYLGSTPYEYSKIDEMKGVLGGIEFPSKDAENYYVYVEQKCGSSVSEKLQSKQITLTATDITPAAPNFDSEGVSVCLNTQVTLPTIQGKTLKWYDAATGGNVVAQTTFTATANTDYYAVVVGDCESARTKYSVTIKTKPTVTLNPTSNNVCSGSTINNIEDYVTVNTTGSQVSWYSEQSGGEALAGNTPLEATTYYAEAILDGCPSDRASFGITAVLNAPSENPSVTAPESICNGQSAIIELNNKTQGYTYYVNDVVVEFTDNKYTVKPTSTTTYTIKAENKCGYKETQKTITVNPLPRITAISVNNSTPVINEDVLLTVEGSDIETVEWSITSGNNASLSDASGNSVKLTSTASGAVTVTATAISINGCRATSTKEVTFKAVDECEPNVTPHTKKTKIRAKMKEGQTSWNVFKIYSYGVTDSDSNGWPGAEMDLGTGEDEGYYVYTFENVTADFNIILNNGNSGGENQTVSGAAKAGKIYTFEVGAKNCSQDNDTRRCLTSTNTDYTTTTDPDLTAPAVKTVSATSEEGSGVVTFTGKIINMGCATATNVYYGYQFKKADEEWPTSGVQASNTPEKGKLIPCTNASATALNYQFSANVEGLENGNYHFRAYIINGYNFTNGNYDQGVYYGLEKLVTVSTVKIPVSEAVIYYSNMGGATSGGDEGELNPNPVCKGSKAYIKLSYQGSQLDEIQWLVDGVVVENKIEQTSTTDLFVFTVSGTETISARLKNEANEGEWVETNVLEYTMAPEPVSPTISFDKGTICSGNTASLILSSVKVGQSYQLFKQIENDGVYTDERVDDVTLVCTVDNEELKFTGLNESGKYFVKAYNAECTNLLVPSQTATLDVINSADLKISIVPTATETTPWMPVKLTVEASSDYTITSTPNDAVINKISNNTYKVKLPLPASANKGEDNTVNNVTFSDVDYVVEATLISVTGEAQECVESAKSTITLKQYIEPCTQK